MCEHINGPWRYEFHSGYVVGPGDKVLAFVSRSACEADPSLPKLITAAPELLEALQFVISAHGEQLHDAFAKAQEAIAKATTR